MAPTAKVFEDSAENCTKAQGALTIDELYGLSLAIGTCHDPQTICRDFVGALFPCLRLGYAGVWLPVARADKSPDPCFELLFEEPCTPQPRDVPQPGPSRSLPIDAPFVVFDCATLATADARQNKDEPATGACLALGELGWLEIRRPSPPFAHAELSALLPLLARLAVALQAALASTRQVSFEPITSVGEARFRAMAEQSADWIWVLDTHGCHTYTNNRGSAILGFPRDAFLSTDPLELVHPADQALFHATFREALDRRAGWHNLLLRWRHCDGSYRVLESSASALLDADGRVVEFQGIDRDVTGRIDREQASRRLASIVEHSRDFIGIAAPDGRIQVVNPAGRAMVGLEPGAEVESKHIPDFIHESSTRLFADEVTPAMLQAGHWEGELCFRDFRSGAAIPVQSEVFRIDGRDGAPLHIATVSRDIRERKRNDDLLDRHNRLLRSVAAGSAILVTERDEHAMMVAICRVLVEQGQYRMAWIGRVDADGVRVLPIASAGIGNDYLAVADIRCDNSPKGQGPTGTAIRANRSVVNDNVDANVYFAPWRGLAHAAAFCSSAATPLRVQGRVIGALNVYSSESAAFGSDEVVLLEKLAADLGSALERHWAEAALRESEERYRLISSVTTDMLYSCVRDDDGMYVIDWAVGSVEPIFGCSIEELKGQGCWRCFVYPADLPVFDREIEDLSPGQRSECELRVVHPDGSLRFTRAFSKVVDDDGRHRIYGACQDITERKQAEERIEFLAHHDELTGLPNRVLLRDRFLHAVALADRHSSHVALLFLDLDNFKVINDTLGHVAGDRLLQGVVARLRECVRDIDTVSRQGGDEFIVLLDDVPHTAAVERIAREILRDLATPFDIDGHLFTTSGSIGICLYPEDGRGFDTLLQKADTAMYAAKEAGRNGYRFFDAEMNRRAQEHLWLQHRLHQALAAEELVLHYQPQLELAGGRVLGVEALLRWAHPELGEVSPARFVPLAEDCGLIVPIGAWVLERACREARRLADAGLGALAVSVNLSALQLRRGDLVESVAAALDRSGLPPHRLELELTESVLLHDAEQALASLGRLKAMGVRLAIDDFGTGYSSLSYLRRLPIDRLKIDRSFVSNLPTDPDSAAIVYAILQLARSMHLDTLAEGVENPEQLEFLRAAGCAEAQGYLFSPALSASDLELWIRERDMG